MREIIRAAFVIGRRDLTAIIFSKAFILFLLGPLFPVIVAIAAGSLGSQIEQDADKPVIGIMMSAEETAKLIAVRDELAEQVGPNWYPEMKALGVGASAESTRTNLVEKKNINC